MCAGMLSPKLYTKCGRSLDGWWCIPSGTPWSTRLQHSRKKLWWTNETNAADQSKLITMDFTSTRAFSNHNIVVTTHGNILQTCLQTNRIDPIDWDLVQQTQLFKNLYSVGVIPYIWQVVGKSQESVPWTKGLGTMHMASSVACKKNRSR